MIIGWQDRLNMLNSCVEGGVCSFSWPVAALCLSITAAMCCFLERLWRISPGIYV